MTSKLFYYTTNNICVPHSLGESPIGNELWCVSFLLETHSYGTKVGEIEKNGPKGLKHVAKNHCQGLNPSPTTDQKRKDFSLRGRKIS